MANEAVCIETPSRFARYTVADATACPIGTIMKLDTDPHTVSLSDSADDSFAGIVWVAKAANDGVTELVLALDGVWDITDAGAGSAIGVAVALAGANTVATADAADLLNGAFMGFVEETQGAAEVCRTRLTKFGSSGQL